MQTSEFLIPLSHSLLLPWLIWNIYFFESKFLESLYQQDINALDISELKLQIN